MLDCLKEMILEVIDKMCVFVIGGMVVGMGINVYLEFGEFVLEEIIKLIG